MLRRPVEQPQGLGPRRGIELARPRPDLDPCFDRPEPQIPPHGVARDLELARDAFGAPSSPVQLADLANHLGVDHRHLRSRWCHARRLCRHVSSSLGPREKGSDLDSDGGHYCDRPTSANGWSRMGRRKDSSMSSESDHHHPTCKIDDGDVRALIDSALSRAPRTLEDIYFVPWVGKNFGNSEEFGQTRVLILGESHYEWCRACWVKKNTRP